MITLTIFHRNMKRLTVLTAALLLVFSLPAEAQEESVAIGPRIGIDVGDVEEVFIGADARFSSEDFRLILNPTFDYYFTDDPVSFWSLSANALYPFGVEEVEDRTFTPYAGAGVGIYRTSVEGDVTAGPFNASTTDLGLNFKFGAIVPGGAVAPFAEAQYSPVFADNNFSIFSIKGGLLFGF